MELGHSEFKKQRNHLKQLLFEKEVQYLSLNQDL